MFKDLNPYRQTCDVSLPWLASLPSTWRLLRVKDVLRPVDVRSETGSEELLTVSSNRGVVPRSSANVTMFQASSYAGHKLCWPGDLVINSLWAWGNGLGVSGHHGIVSTAYGVYRPTGGGDLNPAFLHALVRSQPFNWELQYRSRGVWKSRLQLTDDRFLAAPIPLPPTGEQAAIVKYLGHAHARIDRAIAAKRKLIALLEEQKQAIIHQAVTRGLDPSVPLRDSGILWLGKIPAHWSVVSTAAVSRLIQTGPFGSQLHADDYVDDGIPVINPSHLRDGQIIPDREVAVNSYSAARLDRHAVKLDDILIARRGDLGRSAVVQEAEVGWLCGTGSLILRLRHELMSPPYYQAVFSGAAVKAELESTSVGSTMANLSAGTVSRFRIPVPPLEEQGRIVQAVVDASALSADLRRRLSAEIDLLHEFRTRLTSDVVTGQVDVREIAATLPEFTVDEHHDTGTELDEELDEILDADSGAIDE